MTARPILEEDAETAEQRDFKEMQKARNKIFDRMTMMILEKHRNVSLKGANGSRSPSLGGKVASLDTSKVMQQVTLPKELSQGGSLSRQQINNKQ